MKISCDEAKQLIEKYFRKKTSKKENKKLISHCENCEICRALFYNLRDANPNISEEAFNKILKDNIDVTRRLKLRKRVIIITGIVILFLALVITSFVFLQNGKVTYFAKIDYSDSHTYLSATPEHPSYEAIKQTMDISKRYFKEIGKGCVLTSLRYNPELTYNKSKGYEDAIVIDFSYTRLYPVKGSTNSFFTPNDTLSFVYIPKQMISFEQTRGLNEKE